MTSLPDRSNRDRDDPIIEYCVSNVDRAVRTAIECSARETRGYPCLERCGTCRCEPFLVVDGTVHRAASHRALLDRFAGGDRG